MALKILTNSVWSQSAVIKVTDTSNADTTEQTGIETLIGGLPHLYWTSSDTTEKRIVYLNKNSGISSTHFILKRADKHLGHKINLYKSSSYSSSISSVVSSSDPIVAGDLIGTNDDSLVLECASTNVEALIAEFKSGTGGTYTKYIHQCFFSTAFDLEYTNSYKTLSLPFPSVITKSNKTYLVNKQISISVNKLTRTQINSFYALYKINQEPFFLYDSTGNFLRKKLIHCIANKFAVSQATDDHYILNLDLYELRH